METREDEWDELDEWEKNINIQLEGLIRNDNKDEFVSFLKPLSPDLERGTSEHGFVETQLLTLICLHRALGCASALLNGETGFDVSLNYGLDCPRYSKVYRTPLAAAAESFCFPLTKLFLKHGANPSLSGNDNKGIVLSLPLYAALNALRNHELLRDFCAGGQGTVHQLFSLFWLPELKEPLDVIKLVASKTKQLIRVAVHCVEEGDLVKLAALSMVAWDKLSGDNFTRGSPVCHLILMQHAMESDVGKKEIMRSMWDALCLLERSGNFVEQYRITSMVKDDVVPLKAAYQFLIAVKLPVEQRLVSLVDGDRLTPGLQQGDEVTTETHLLETMNPKSITPEHEELHVQKKQDFSADFERFAVKLQLADKVLLESALLEKMSSNSMINKCIYFTPTSPRTDVEEIRRHYFYCELHDILSLDDKDEFVKLINESGCSDRNDEPLESVRQLMFSLDSANCAAAVLAGETKSFFTISDLTDVNWPSLHNAARFEAPRLTALFLENGFRPDLRKDYAELNVNLQAALPLNVAVESIRANCIFQGCYDKKSAINLVGVLCDYYFRNRLETVRLLVQKTSNVHFEFLRYLNEGKMVELCALLLVGCKELLPSAVVMRSLASASIARNAGVAGFSTSFGHTNLHQDVDLLERKGTFLLIDIFEKIGDSLAAYVRLEQPKGKDQIMSEILWLISSAGISETQVSKVGDCLPRGLYVADHEASLGRSYRSIVIQPSSLKVPNTFPNHTTPNLMRRFLPSAALNVSTFLAPSIPANGLIERRYSPIQCVSVVSALKKGIRRF